MNAQQIPNKKMNKCSKSQLMPWKIMSARTTKRCKGSVHVQYNANEKFLIVTVFIHPAGD